MHAFALRFITNLPHLGRVDASQQIGTHLLPQINHPAASIYRRIVCRIAIAYLCQLYSIDFYTHQELAVVSRECLDLLENVKPQCGPLYYASHFARLEKFASSLFRWHASKASVCPLPLAKFSALSIEDQEADAAQVAQTVQTAELEEALELFRQHKI